MKKILLTMCIAGSSFLGYSQFTPGNLVVLQATNDGAPATSSPYPAPTVSLVEFTQAGGSPVSTLAFPGTGAGRVVLANGTGASTFEGYLKLSTDLNYITFGGYDADPGTENVSSSSTATYPRLIVNVNKDKVVSMASTTGGSPRYIRFAVAKNNDEVWVGGNSQTIRYLKLSTLAGGDGTDVITSTSSNTSAGIFYDKLYYTTSGTSSSAEIKRLPGLPTSESTPETVIPRSAGLAGNLTDFIFFDTDNDNDADLAYIGTDGSSANVYKFKLEDVGGTPTWVLKGTLAAPAELLSDNRKLVGITGYKKADGTYAIYYTTFNSIVSFVDTALPSADITGTPAVIASAPTNSIFRGISFTPGTTPAILPIELKSFNGKAEGDRIRLDWSTASEKNNSHFEILRSATGAPSEVIGTVQGSGNSDVSKAYSFVDANPAAGVNYYQLNQVDANGDSHKSNVIQVKSGVKATGLTISKGEGESIIANVYSEKNASGRLYVSDMSGRKINEVNVSLQKGYNNISVSTLGFKTGVYIVTLNTAGENLSVKFVK